VAMPGINLEALNTGDLRRLLQVARERDDEPLADELERQIAARATSAPRIVSPFATLPEEAPQKPRFRMNADDEAPTGLEFKARAADHGRLLTLGLGALAGCLATGAVIWGAQWLGAQAKSPPPAQDVTLASVAPAPLLPGLSEAVLIAGASTPSLAPLDQAFSGSELAAPPAAKAAPKKPPRKRPARAHAVDPETEEEATAMAQGGHASSALTEWLKRRGEEEPIY